MITKLKDCIVCGAPRLRKLGWHQPACCSPECRALRHRAYNAKWMRERRAYNAKWMRERRAEQREHESNG